MFLTPSLVTDVVLLAQVLEGGFLPNFLTVFTNSSSDPGNCYPFLGFPRSLAHAEFVADFMASF